MRFFCCYIVYLTKALCIRGYSTVVVSFKYFIQSFFYFFFVVKIQKLKFEIEIFQKKKNPKQINSRMISFSSNCCDLQTNYLIFRIFLKFSDLTNYRNY